MNSLDPITVSAHLTDAYRRYLRSLISPSDPRIAAALSSEIDKLASGRGGMVKGPYLEITPAYEQGETSRELIEKGQLSLGFARLEGKTFSLDRPWYMHQVRALHQINLGRNVVVATGTGSGKTESFLLPILNAILHEFAESGVTPGVRALLLYPMNALANDQLKRLRQLLANVPEITFGRYTGETLDKAQDAEKDFHALHPGVRRLPNELLSREEMRRQPPHLLLTNYAMLEYLLLRPEDSELFGAPDNSTWKFIVVDEAHMYDGAIGAEIGYLLRRLRERVATEGRLQSIATSATVGSDGAKAATFASNLFGAPFDHQRGDIVTSTSKNPFQRPAWGELPASSLFDGQSLDGLVRTAREAGAPAGTPYEVLAGERTIRELHEIGRRLPSAIGETLDQLSRHDLTIEQLSTLIDLAAKAQDIDGTPVLSAKYHLFARSTEGAFTCFNPDGPHLSLTRRETCDCGWSVFELAACRRCGGVHFVGSITEEAGSRTFSPKSMDSPRTAWFSQVHTSENDTDEDDDLFELGEDGASVAIGLCPRCGRMSPGTGGTCPNPGCRTTMITVQQSKHTGSELRRCMHCGASSPRIIRRFESGNDAAASVLSTALYQSLPGMESGSSVHLPGQGRKLLVFSDSRQQAAFFAPYLEDTYDGLLRRRILYQAIVAAQFEGEPAGTADIAASARKIATESGVFSDSLNSLQRQSMAETWVQAEMMAIDERISLEGAGLIRWRMREPVTAPELQPLCEYGFTEREARDLAQVLVLSLRLQGAVNAMERVDLTDPIFEPRLGPISVRSSGSDRKKKVLSWNPPGNRQNRRSDYLVRIFAAAGAPIGVTTTVLQGMWDVLTNPGDSFKNWFTHVSSPSLGAVARVNPASIVAYVSSNEDQIWRCDACGTTSTLNVRGVCPRFRCGGTLRDWHSPTDEHDEGHYRHLYRTLRAIPLSALEHTAQWTGREAAAIQQKFIKGEVNVLSCSTTFELGVDVGELQSVVLRNVPPTVSNYIQRVGRAGRRAGSAGLVLTYAQRRSHDLNVFANPASQIGATVRTPVAPIANPRLAERHFFSIALAAFWRDAWESQESRFRTAHSFFGSDMPEAECAASQVLPWLEQNRGSIEAMIGQVVSGTGLHASDWDWCIWTTNLQDLMSQVGADYRAEIELYETLKSDAFANEKGGLGEYYKRISKTLQERHLLGFLANRNIIPKYGFPVDTVEFKISPGESDAEKLELSRDLSQAIFEYAPGSLVVAGGKLWKSVGIARRRERENPPVYYRICRACDAYSEGPEEDRSPCHHCGKPLTGGVRKYIEPRFGFLAEKASDRPGDAPPRISWRGETRIAKDGLVVEEAEVELGQSVITFAVMERASMVRINTGPHDNGFKVCNWCGYSISGGEDWPEKHEDPVRKKSCSGHASFLSLAHRYETDVLRITFPISWEGDNGQTMALSVLYAVLQSASNTLQIAQSNIDGAITSYHTQKSSIDIIDTVPGGAGFARLIAGALPEVLREAKRLVDSCECGPETSCYSCLRRFSNQRVHDHLERGAAAQYFKTLFHNMGGD